ncbi:MAG: polysaccharide deacetylase [Promethearchaeota archaeon]|nr:MAG: polysaccharide deacetylase [Candidatus Lokiarchaeota archaeon]
MTDKDFKHNVLKQKFLWPNDTKCAVSLTFDDAHSSQITNGIPLFSKYNIIATFYVSPNNLKRRVNAWKEIIEKGHEIGNHTMSHPCTGNYLFSKDNALENYTLQQIEDDLDKANDYINSVLGIKPRNFAYPCGQKFIGRGVNVESYVPLIAKKFFTGRGYLDESSNDPCFCDFSQLLAMGSDGKTFEELIKLIEISKRLGQWLILVGHKIKQSGVETTYISVLEKLCEYFNDPTNKIWVSTVENIAKYIRNFRQ